MIKIISHAVVASYLLIHYSVPKGTGNYYLFFTAISAYPWHACMAAYHITSQEGCFTYSPIYFLLHQPGKSADPQLGTRLSEDLDFMRWRTSKTERMEVDWNGIQKELSTIGDVQSMNLMDIDHVEFVVSGVKFSFYACGRYSPVTKPVKCNNYLRLADIHAIGAMKMEVMLRRSNLRDYYDIYSIVKSGVDLRELVRMAGNYSQHQLKSKNILAMLTNGTRFHRDEIFNQMQPKYNVTAADIENYFRSLLTKCNNVSD